MPTPSPGPQPPSAVAEIRKVPSVAVALRDWFFTIVLFSALEFAGPLFVPPLHDKGGKFDLNVSFGGGELLGFGLALFAATASRWITHRGRGDLPLRSVSTVGLALVAMAISGVWLDRYELHTGSEQALFVSTSHVLVVSWILVGASVVCGVLGETFYALSLRPSAVRVV
jgi:hypothetical protein